MYGKGQGGVIRTGQHQVAECFWVPRLHVRRDIFGGCRIREGIFAFDFCEGIKGIVNIIYILFQY